MALIVAVVSFVTPAASATAVAQSVASGTIERLRLQLHLHALATEFSCSQIKLADAEPNEASRTVAHFISAVHIVDGTRLRTKYTRLSSRESRAAEITSRKSAFSNVDVFRAFKSSTTSFGGL